LYGHFSLSLPRVPEPSPLCPQAFCLDLGGVKGKSGIFSIAQRSDFSFAVLEKIAQMVCFLAHLSPIGGELTKIDAPYSGRKLKNALRFS
jgi:hypothetical protein